jgi:hypothetical protein
MQSRIVSRLLGSSLRPFTQMVSVSALHQKARMGAVAAARTTWCRNLSGSKPPPLIPALIPQTSIKLPGIEEAISMYRSSGSLESLAQVENIISVERHALELNNRLHGMLGKQSVLMRKNVWPFSFLSCKCTNIQTGDDENGTYHAHHDIVCIHTVTHERSYLESDHKH